MPRVSENPRMEANELFDDGSARRSRDDQAGDGVYTRNIELPPGVPSYVFLVSADVNRPRRYRSTEVPSAHHKELPA